MILPRGPTFRVWLELRTGSQDSSVSHKPVPTTLDSLVEFSQQSLALLVPFSVTVGPVP
jgi:hypothetical protein